MPLTTRYGFADTPHIGDASLAWTTLSAGASAGASALGVADASAFPPGVEFDIEVGVRDSDGTLEAANVENAHVLSISGSTLNLAAPLTYAHASGESVYHGLTALGLKYSPGVMTDAGDVQYLGAAGRPLRLAAGADGTYLRYASGVPTAGAIQAGDLPDLSGTYLTPAAAAAAYLASGTTRTANTVYAGPTSGSAAAGTFRALVAADLPDISSVYALKSYVDSGDAAVLALIPTNNSQLSNGSGYITASSSSALTNKTGAISQWTNDASYTTLAAVAGVGYLTSVTAHALLSATHSDTTASAVLRGGLITGQGASATWKQLAIGTSGKVLGSDGTDASWITIATSNFASANVSQWTNDASYTTLAAVAGVGYLTSVTAHNLLSTTHGDTLADTVVRGDLLYGNSTPKWARLAKPSVLSGLSHDGTDVSWVTATGTGAPVRATSPTLVTPTLGAATATKINGNTFTSGTYTLTGAAGKTLTFNNSITLAGTDSTTMTFPATSATIARTDAGNTFTGNQTVAGPGSSATSGTDLAATITATWNPSSTSTLVGTGLLINPTVNFSAGTPGAGSYEALRIKVVETALPTGTNYLIRASAGSAGTTDKFTVSNTGAITAAATLTLSGGNLGIANGFISFGGSFDVNLVRDAAAIFAQRNGTSAQAFRLYNTFTTLNTAGEWFAIDWITTANVVNLQAVKGSSTGTARVLNISYGGAQASPVTAISVPITSGNITFGGGITTPGGAALHTTNTALTDGAGVALGTLGTAPSAGNPTKWIGINDNGTTRYVPAW